MHSFKIFLEIYRHPTHFFEIDFVQDSHPIPTFLATLKLIAIFRQRHRRLESCCKILVQYKVFPRVIKLTVANLSAVPWEFLHFRVVENKVLRP